ncbi:MAG: glutamine synthetase family protein [Pseudomonadota bacterium]
MPDTPTDKPADGSTPAHTSSQRGVANMEEAKQWLRARGIEDIEVLTVDLAGMAKGKMLPASKFLDNQRLALPGSLFQQTISGDYPEESDTFEYDPADGDLRLEPDFSTLTEVPWESDPTAQIICDVKQLDGTPSELVPRNVLRHVLAQYEARGWKPVVAPEIEFYLVKQNPDPDYPLEPPMGRSGRQIIGGQSYSISGINEFDEMIDDLYDHSERQGLEIDTLIHEEGAAQLEINMRHGDALELADQVFAFKRTIREVALAHDMYATFMAKPIQNQPGSAMHIHQSVVDAKTGSNIFVDEEGQDTALFRMFIGGLQLYMPAAISLVAPYVNSYRRLIQSASAPVNMAWGVDNRTAGLRVPVSEPAARRVENRVPSSDANPYLAIAASLACGYLGMTQEIMANSPTEETVNEDEISLPRGLLEAVTGLETSDALKSVLGTRFVNTYAAIKRLEYETFMQVISPWEREHLLLNV